MPITESIILFSRESFLLPYQFASCVLIWKQWILLSNEKWAPVTVKYNQTVAWSPRTRALYIIAIIARRTFLL